MKCSNCLLDIKLGAQELAGTLTFEHPFEGQRIREVVTLCFTCQEEFLDNGLYEMLFNAKVE